MILINNVYIDLFFYHALIISIYIVLCAVLCTYIIFNNAILILQGNVNMKNIMKRDQNQSHCGTCTYSIHELAKVLVTT